MIETLKKEIFSEQRCEFQSLAREKGLSISESDSEDSDTEIFNRNLKVKNETKNNDFDMMVHRKLMIKKQRMQEMKSKFYFK